MNRQDRSFEQRIEASPSLRELGRFFLSEIRPFGFEVFACGHLGGGQSERCITLTNWPRAWMELYAANGFAAEDAAVEQALLSPDPFTWSEIQQQRPGASRRILEAAAKFGWHDGFVVPIHGPGDARGIVSLAAGQLRMSAVDRPVVEAIARCTYAQARRLHQARDLRPRALAPREREALALVAQGMNDGEIGAALGVTRTSAHVYVERAKRRLGTSTRAQAIAYALENGLL